MLREVVACYFRGLPCYVGNLAWFNTLTWTLFLRQSSFVLLYFAIVSYHMNIYPQGSFAVAQILSLCFQSSLPNTAALNVSLTSSRSITSALSLTVL